MILVGGWHFALVRHFVLVQKCLGRHSAQGEILCSYTMISLASYTLPILQCRLLSVCS